MLSIACCDDTEIDRNIISDILEDYIQAHKIETNVSVFQSGTELLHEIDKGGAFDIYFLDMMMPFLNGIELATELRKRNLKGRIVFITASSDFVFDAFRVHAYHYIVKPIESVALFKLMDELLGELREENPNIIKVKTKSGVRRLNIDEIYYITREDRALCYHMADGSEITTVNMRASSTEMFASILEDKRFFGAGVSLVVNMSKIVTFERGYIVLNDGTELFPPERSYSKMKAAYDSF